MLELMEDRQVATRKRTAVPAPQGIRGIVVTAAWFGLLTGWLELAVVMAKKAVNPHVSMDMLRTNRHFVWMTPVADLLIFGAVGLLLAALGRFSPKVARWLVWRGCVALLLLALLLTAEGLYRIAGVSLACGVGSWLGPGLGRRGSGLRRLVRASFPLMCCVLWISTSIFYQRVVSSERRALAACPPAARGAKTKNVLLIVLDNVRAGSMSLYGHDRPTTPNLQRLARRGVVFTEARSPSSWTLPTHASMFTGQWPHKLSAGCDLPLDATYPTLAEALAARGYATAGFVGNTYYCNAIYGLGRGFARYIDCYENQTVSLFEIVHSAALGRQILQALGYPIKVAKGNTSVRKTAAMLNRDLLGWLDGRPARRPFFAFVNYYDAHGPFIAPDCPDPRFGLGALPDAEKNAIIERYLSSEEKHMPPGDERDRLLRQATDVFRDSYESCLASLDRHIGLLFDELQRRKLLDDTLVIVTSDHGEHFRERGFFGHGRSLYRPEVHVPLVIFDPSDPAPGRTVDEPVSLREVAATAAEWAGGPAGRSPFPGRSLARFWSEGPRDDPAAFPVLCEVEQQTDMPKMPWVPSSLGPVKSLVAEGLGYIQNGDGREELYNLADDRLEVKNLAAEAGSGPVLERFRAALARVLRE